MTDDVLDACQKKTHMLGSFERNYEFDAVVLDDSRVPHPGKLSLAERLERAVYLGLDRNGILAKYVSGKQTEGFPLVSSPRKSF